MMEREERLPAQDAAASSSPPAETTRQMADHSAPHGVPPTQVRYQVIAWLTGAAALAYLCRNSLGIAESQIRADLGITLAQSGYMMGAFFWSYAFLQVPTGAFSHKYGTRIALPIFVIAWSIMTLATGLAPGLWLLIVAQLLMGAAQAGIFPAATNTINYWMPMAHRSIGCGILSAGMQVGAIVCSVLMGALVSVIGWRWSFVLISPLGIV